MAPPDHASLGNVLDHYDHLSIDTKFTGYSIRMTVVAEKKENVAAYSVPHILGQRIGFEGFDTKLDAVEMRLKYIIPI